MRFQHGSGGDPEGFRARCALLAEDLADVPADLLRTAAAAWVREQPFLPTAADLTRLMREELERRDREAAPPQPPRPGFDPARSFCDLRNATIAASPDPHRSIEWFVDDTGEPKLRYRREPLPGVAPIHPDDVAARNRSLATARATFRYDVGGYPRDLTDDEEDHRRRAGGGVMPWQR